MRRPKPGPRPEPKPQPEPPTPKDNIRPPSPSDVIGPAGPGTGGRFTPGTLTPDQIRQVLLDRDRAMAKRRGQKQDGDRIMPPAPISPLNPDRPPVPDRPRPNVPRPDVPNPDVPKPKPNSEAEAAVDAVKGMSDADKQRAKSMTKFEELVLKYINEERVKHGLNELKFDPRLQLIALNQSKYQEKTGRCGHFQNTPGWRNSAERMKQVGLPPGWAENAAFGWRDPGDGASQQQLEKEARSLVNGWKSSPGHYRTMLTKNVTIAGISQFGRASTLDLA